MFILVFSVDIFDQQTEIENSIFLMMMEWKLKVLAKCSLFI